MQSERRRLYRKLWARNKRRTIPGFLDEKYRAMTLRVRGLVANRSSSALGLPILTKEHFLVWAHSQNCLVPMFEKYKKSGWKRNLCPTIDRVDNSRGYTIDNIQFLTMLDNLKKDNWRKKRPSRLLYKTNTSGHRYINWNKRDNRWMVIKDRRYFGQYKTVEEAVITLRQIGVGKNWGECK